MILVCCSLLDGDDAWNVDDMNGAMDLSVTSENNMDHDFVTGELVWCLIVVSCCCAG